MTHPGGRPTSYKKKYCALVIELGREGKSKAQIAAAIGVARTTLDNWSAEHQEFLGALEISRDLALNWWETKAQDHMIEVKDGAKINSAIWSRSMAARFPDDYRENSKLELSGQLALDKVADEDLDHQIAALSAAVAKATENG